MTEEEVKNKEKRKNTPLTKEEYLTFFFFPYSEKYTETNQISYTKNFNESENKRFMKHGFDTKIKQAKNARTLGIIFYAILLFIVIMLIQYFNLV